MVAIEGEYGRSFGKNSRKMTFHFGVRTLQLRRFMESSWRSLRDTHLIVMTRTLCGCEVFDAEHKITAWERS